MSDLLIALKEGADAENQRLRKALAFALCNRLTEHEYRTYIEPYKHQKVYWFDPEINMWRRHGS